MVQENIVRSVTGTFLVVGLMAGTINPNNTFVIMDTQNKKNGYYINNDYQNYNEGLNINSNNQIEKIKRNAAIEEEASLLFGNMREATTEERKSVRDYINSISKPTGVNFFDLC